MRAIVKERAGRGISFASFAIPVPGPGEALVKVKIAGICGTDLHIYEWDEWSQKRIKPPIIPGHEFSGEICELGAGVSGFRTGQRVSAEGHITCGRCKHCRNGQGHICREVEILGVDRNGCFAEYIAVPAGNLWPVDDSISDRHAAVYDPIGNAMHTIMAQQVSMKTVLVTGAGSIGLFAIPILLENGALRIIVVEPNEMKREIAIKLGADAALDPRDKDIKEAILSIAGGQGPDVLLEMSGNAGSIRLGLDVLCNGGTVSMLGIPAGNVPLNLAEEVIFKGITIHGITGRRMYETWYQTESFLKKNGRLIEPVLTHTVAMDRIEDGFRMMEDGRAAKVLVNIN